MPIKPHASHRFTRVAGTLCCGRCYCEPDWPLAETRCGGGDRIERSEAYRRARGVLPHRSDELRKRRGVATDEQIVAEIRAGLVASAIAKKLRCSLARIREVQIIYGVEIVDARICRARPAEDLSAMAADYASGLTIDQVAKKHRTSRRTVGRALREHKATRPPGRVKV